MCRVVTANIFVMGGKYFPHVFYVSIYKYLWIFFFLLHNNEIEKEYIQIIMFYLLYILHFENYFLIYPFLSNYNSAEKQFLFFVHKKQFNKNVSAHIVCSIIYMFIFQLNYNLLTWLVLYSVHIIIYNEQTKSFFPDDLFYKL